MLSLRGYEDVDCTVLHVILWHHLRYVNGDNKKLL